MPSVVASNAWSAIAATGVLRAIRVAIAARDIAALLAPMLMLMHCSSRAIAATTAGKAGLQIDYRLPVALASSSHLSISTSIDRTSKTRASS